MSTITRPDTDSVGKPIDRIDGPAKVRGEALYTSDHSFPDMLYAVPVCATIAKGRIERFDASDARTMPGVHAVLDRATVGPFYRISSSKAKVDEERPPLEDDVVRYYGQYVGVVVADRFEQAVAAAAKVRVNYLVETPDVSTSFASDEPTVAGERGDVEAAFAAAAAKIDRTYTTPVENHEVIELHATVALFDGESYTLYETTQGVANHKDVSAQMIGVAPEKVRVISKFLGSGFGSKLWPWPQSLLAVAAARHTLRPVKLVVSRTSTFESTGHRPFTQQHVRLSASREGVLQSLEHDSINHTGVGAEYVEDCSEATIFFYGVDNLKATTATVERNVGVPTSMRGPGAAPGLFATESALDELSIALEMDPVALRVKNEPAIDQNYGVPFSSRHYVECLETGAEKFGWGKRNPVVGSMRGDGGTVLGWGMAGCSWMAAKFAGQARVELRIDGTVRVVSATQDIGTGTYTAMAQMAAQELGIPVNRIGIELGDTNLPAGSLSGGSTATASLASAIAEAAQAVKKALLGLAAKAESGPFAGAKPDALSYEDGRVRLGGSGESASFADVLERAHAAMVAGTGSSEATMGDEHPTQSIHSYGAQFVEVSWQPELARLRVKRFVTVIDGGRIINPKTSRNQIAGALMMGVGMAMFEETQYDRRSGKPLGANLAEYLVTTHADAPPHLDITFLNYPDYALNPLGARGIGEIGIAGVAPAIANAVYHATGVRVRNLPIKIEDLIASKGHN